MQNNKIITIIGVILVIVVLIQSYFIYSLKKEVKKNSIEQNKMVALHQKQPIINHTQPTIPQQQIIIEDPFKDFTAKDFDPFKEIEKMHKEMERVFGNFNTYFLNSPTFSNSFKDLRISPLSDFIDKGDKYEIKMNIPGSNDNKIKIDTKDNQINILAEVDKTTENNSSNYFKRERYVQKFQRIFTLPKDADISKMTKEYKNGVLTIEIPKKKG